MVRSHAWAKIKYWRLLRRKAPVLADPYFYQRQCLSCKIIVLIAIRVGETHMCAISRQLRGTGDVMSVESMINVSRIKG
jgi:hypothetical protein